MTDRPEPATTEDLTVIIIDDHRLVRQGIRAFLDVQHGIRVVGEADDGESAIALAAEARPDVALVDLVMGRVSGVETVRRLAEVSPHTKPMVLTSFDDDGWVFAALRAGAVSYVLKDIDPDGLADAIRRTARGESVLHPRVAGRVVRQVRGRIDDTLAMMDALTDREYEVVRHIAAGESNRDIARSLGVSEKTVKGHVGHVLDKLGVVDRTQVAIFAWRHGIADR